MAKPIDPKSEEAQEVAALLLAKLANGDYKTVRLDDGSDRCDQEEVLCRR